MSKNYSFELHEFKEALSPYGFLDTVPPDKEELVIDDFRDGVHFRTGSEDGTNSLILKLEDRILTCIVDESGSCTYNDKNADRYHYLKRLLTKLNATYPGKIQCNLIGFGGVPVSSSIFITQSGGNFLTSNGLDFSQFLQKIFEDSVFDFSGVRIVRRSDRFPEHPADGFILTEGLYQAYKDTNLTQNQQYYYGIWCFNKEKHFNNGKFISGTPRDPILPQGVTFATANPKILPGVERDSYTQVIYNFTEGLGFVVFDSSGNGQHGSISSQAIEDSFWSGDSATISHIGENLKKKNGVKFDSEFDIIETQINLNCVVIGNRQSITINFWILRYNQELNSWIIGTSTESPSNNVGWCVGVSPLGNILITIDGSVQTNFNNTFNTLIEDRTWTMITVIINSNGLVSVYKNSLLNSSVNIGTSFDGTGFNTLFIGAKPVDDFSEWSGTDFFGVLNQISISNTVRDQSWISNTYNQELIIHNQTIIEFVSNPPDNKQREVLVSWQIGSDFNYSDGIIKIIRKYNEIPSNDQDGHVIFETNATTGQSFFLDSFDFIHNSNYYYRIFTYNNLGNPCDRTEARILPVLISKSIGNNIVSSVINVSIISGNKKIQVEWDIPNDSSILGFKVYFGHEKFPTISISPTNDIEVSDGIQICDTVLSYFIHRTLGKNCDGTDILLTNGKQHFYTIVSYNIYNSLSPTVNVIGIPSADNVIVFIPDEIIDLHDTILNENTISLQWQNPTIKSERLDLFFGESSLVYFKLQDLYGGDLEDFQNFKVKFCTTVTVKDFKTSEQYLDNSNGLPGFDKEFNPSEPCSNTPMRGGHFIENTGDTCNNNQGISETIIFQTNPEYGLVKSIVTHTNDRQILSKRERYTINIFAQYEVDKNDNPIFQYSTPKVTVTFSNPIKMTMINKLMKFIPTDCRDNNEPRPIDEVCTCNEVLNKNPCETHFINGGYIKARIPYICRVEVQYKGEALPDGTPITVLLFKHKEAQDFIEKSTRTTIEEGLYQTSSIDEPELGTNGLPTGNIISKSIIDIEIIHPNLPDYIDVYSSLDFGGFLTECIHSIKFVGSLFIRINGSKPSPDGIDVAEEYASVWQINPDDPGNLDGNIIVPDGTLVKWELIKGRHGLQRPFYSTEQLNIHISGIYSRTSSGVARHVFLGPIGNLEKHFEELTCKDEEGNIVSADSCCLSEEYEIHATVIADEQTATDAIKLAYSCGDTSSLTNKRFLMNIAPNQTGSNPHWITWADGEHLLKFQISKNPAISDMFEAECFRSCVQSQIGGQLFEFTNNQIIQINAPGEIIWNAAFDIDPYTGKSDLKKYDSVLPSNDEYGTLTIANIPILGETTDFYLRLNKFITANPKPQECSSGNEGGGGLGGADGNVNPCEWENICNLISGCISKGTKWDGVDVVSGTTTLILNNQETTLFGGGDYEKGIPPIYVGFKEPLNIRIIEARVNGSRVSELIVDGFSVHTFVVEITFSGLSVPDGTPIEIEVEGQDSGLISLNNNTIYTRQINDPFINPDGNVRSFAFFDINPLPNISFSIKINVSCRYDKLGTAIRLVTQCIDLKNEINEQPPTSVPPIGSETQDNSSVSNQTILYDTLENNYKISVESQISRVGHFAFGMSLSTSSNSGIILDSSSSTLTDRIYVFGGFTGNTNSQTNSITPTSEIFDILNKKWTFTTDMPTPRCFGMTVSKDHKIYCIGGVELDPLLNQNMVSRKIECFNIQTEQWNETLLPMPEHCGVAYGEAFCVNNSIYVVCGIKTILDNSKPGDLNDKILKYSIINNTWEIITPSNFSLFQRISPFGFYRSNPQNIQSDSNNQKQCYIYGGAISKSPSEIENERNSIITDLLNQFRSFILTSAYYQNLTPDEQTQLIQDKEQEIRNGVIVPAYIYLSTGFKFLPESEELVNFDFTLDISNTLDDEWTVLPVARNLGRCIYIPQQDIVYFIGGSDQNKSTTLNILDAIDLFNNNVYDRRLNIPRGISMESCAIIGSDIYILGGLTSGHKEGWVEIQTQTMPEFIETIGKQSCGIAVTLRNDSGEIIQDDIRINVSGRLRMPIIDDILVQYTAKRSADRALGGDGSGNAPTSNQGNAQTAQNSILDPNSDQFQYNSAKKLAENVSLFPVIYSRNDFIVQNGLGTTTLIPRSEDPLEDFSRLSEFIKTLTDNMPPDNNQIFTGDFTRDELLALGDILSTINPPPIIIEQKKVRNLYKIETDITVLDNFYFGQTVSDFDLQIQQSIQNQINQIIQNQNNQNDPSHPAEPAPSTETKCFSLQHSAQPTIPPSDTPPQSSNPTNPGGTGGFVQSGQCLFCLSILPMTTDVRNQLSSPISNYFNTVEWIPQTKRRVIGNSSLSDAINEINKIKFEIPFGSSNIYDAINIGASEMSGEIFEDLKKSIYIVSDNSENLSIISRDNVINNVNSIDGLKQVPIIYVVFSTSFPLSIAALFERSEFGDINKLTQNTGGQSTSLIDSKFLSQILNLSIQSTIGGLGYGSYKNSINLGNLSSITSMKLNFNLPNNTSGFVKLTYSKDGYNFTPLSQKFIGNGHFDLNNLFAKNINIEAVLSTGFAVDELEENDSISTGIPKLKNITFETSVGREDFIFLNKETVLENAQQIGMSFEGFIPNSSIVEIGAATSNSSNWKDYQSEARPPLQEFGKSLFLDRISDSGVVPFEDLTTTDYILYRTKYSSWDSTSIVSIFYIDHDGNKIPIVSGFKLYPRDGYIYFNTKQDSDKKYIIKIEDSNTLRVGVRLVNRLHSESIKVEGIGYIYSTNDNKPPALEQLPPTALNVKISPPSPDSSDQIFALYTFKDVNNDKESGTLISWFKNGTQLFEIQNKSSWNNSDLLLSNKILPNDRIYFIVTPSDGRDYGDNQISTQVTVVARPPSADGLKILPSRIGVIQDRYDTSCDLIVSYDFSVQDNNQSESGTIIKWIVNGRIFKENVFPNNDPYNNPKTIQVGEISTIGNLTAHVIGNIIQVEVTPKTRLISGSTIRSSSITILNTLPVINNVQILPLQPISSSTLSVTYNIVDRDIQTNIQTDQSEIKWFKSINNQTFSEVVELRGRLSVVPFYLSVSDKWYCDIRGFDGLDLAVQTSKSNVVIISPS